MTEILVLREVRKGSTKSLQRLDLQRVDFGLFRTLVQRVAWETVLNNKGVQEGWISFKKKILKVQKLTVSVCQKMSWKGEEIKRVYNLWKKGQSIQEVYNDVVRPCRKKIRKAKLM